MLRWRGQALVPFDELQPGSLKPCSTRTDPRLKFVLDQEPAPTAHTIGRPNGCATDQNLRTVVAPTPTNDRDLGRCLGEVPDEVALKECCLELAVLRFVGGLAGARNQGYV